ncbi:hypothetical protein FNV43_RR00683 [Rhamnella rubrinervis]|uniref:Uncharacterized protein n=1 Tax=Rhamnella rubrinervis TaxID=2594499 RepID=A0A8K0HP36_9ROSA|nr:hypothetical protein FNV43_RR00683 [Rhamnella rubrinervis]
MQKVEESLHNGSKKADTAKPKKQLDGQKKIADPYKGDGIRRNVDNFSGSTKDDTANPKRQQHVQKNIEGQVRESVVAARTSSTPNANKAHNAKIIQETEKKLRPVKSLDLGDDDAVESRYIVLE